MVTFLHVLYGLIVITTLTLVIRLRVSRWKTVSIALAGVALSAATIYSWHHIERAEALARPSMDVKACKPGDPINCTTATDVVSMTPQPDGTLYVEFRDGDWMTGAFIAADESEITVTNVRCNGSSTTKTASDGTPVTMTLCSSNYTFGSR